MRANSIKLKENIAGWLFCLPLVIGLIGFTVLPMILSLMFSFWNYSGFTAPTPAGFANYAKILTDKEMGKVVTNTLLYTFISIPFNLVLSYLLAWLVNREAKGVKAFRVIYYLPVMIPAVVSGLIWKDMFGATFGIFNKVLGMFGSGSKFFNSPQTSVAMPSIFLMSLWGLGGGMILWLAAFKNIPKTLYEAASLDGAGAMRKFVMITIPLSTPMIFFNIVMSFIGTLQYNGTLTFAPNDGKGVENSVFMYALKIYFEAFRRDNLGYASALAWVLLIVIALITALLFSTHKKWVYYREDV